MNVIVTDSLLGEAHSESKSVKVHKIDLNYVADSKLQQLPLWLLHPASP
jgi:hypothetical protein